MLNWFQHKHMSWEMPVWISTVLLYVASCWILVVDVIEYGNTTEEEAGQKSHRDMETERNWSLRILVEAPEG